MKKLIILLFILAIGGACCALFLRTQVYNSTSYIKSFEKFIVELEQKSALTDSEYAEIKKKYIDYSEIYFEKYKSELTEADKSTIFDLKRRYYTTLASIGSDAIIDDVKGFLNKTTEFFKLLFDQTTTEHYE